MAALNARLEVEENSRFSQGDVRAMLETAIALCGIPSSNDVFTFDMRFATSQYVNYVLYSRYGFRYKKSRAERIVKTQDGEECEMKVTVYPAELVRTVAEILARVLLNEDFAGAVLQQYRSRNAAKAEEAAEAEAEAGAAAAAEVDADAAAAAAAAAASKVAAQVAAQAASHAGESAYLALEARACAVCDAAEEAEAAAAAISATEDASVNAKTGGVLFYSVAEMQAMEEAVAEAKAAAENRFDYHMSGIDWGDSDDE